MNSVTIPRQQNSRHGGTRSDRRAAGRQAGREALKVYKGDAWQPVRRDYWEAHGNAVVCMMLFFIFYYHLFLHGITTLPQPLNGGHSRSLPEALPLLHSWLDRGEEIALYIVFFFFVSVLLVCFSLRSVHLMHIECVWVCWSPPPPPSRSLLLSVGGYLSLTLFFLVSESASVPSRSVLVFSSSRDFDECVSFVSCSQFILHPVVVFS